MSPEQTLRIIRAQDLTIRAAMVKPRDMTGWAISFTVKTKLGGSTSLTKTVGGGVTIKDAGRGIIEISLAKADTSSLTVTNSLASGEGYVWDIKRIDSGANVVLARGQLILEQEVTA